MMTPGDIDRLQKECDFKSMKETIDKQQTQIRELIDKKNVVDLDYKEEYYNLQKENEELKNQEAYSNSIPKQKIKDMIEEIQEEGYWLFTTDRDSDKCVEVLQQLLEKEK